MDLGGKVERLRKFEFPIMLIIALALVGSSGYFFKQYKDSQKQVEELKKDPQQAARAENAKLVEKVSKLVVLPEGEDPTIATVTDLEKLKDQPFFANAKNGDKILIYTTAKKAFLYNPQLSKVVEIAPINIGQSATPAPAPAPAATKK